MPKKSATEDCTAFIENLIEHVRRRPHLWDQSEANYKDIVLATQSWVAIAQEMGLEQRELNIHYRPKVLNILKPNGNTRT